MRASARLIAVLIALAGAVAPAASAFGHETCRASAASTLARSIAETRSAVNGGAYSGVEDIVRIALDANDLVTTLEQTGASFSALCREAQGSAALFERLTVQVSENALRVVYLAESAREAAARMPAEAEAHGLARLIVALDRLERTLTGLRRDMVEFAPR